MIAKSPVLPLLTVLLLVLPGTGLCAEQVHDARTFGAWSAEYAQSGDRGMVRMTTRAGRMPGDLADVEYRLVLGFHRGGSVIVLEASPCPGEDSPRSAVVPCGVRVDGGTPFNVTARVALRSGRLYMLVEDVPDGLFAGCAKGERLHFAFEVQEEFPLNFSLRGFDRAYGHALRLRDRYLR